MPNVIYEGFTCVTLIISSKIGGISNVITHNENGLLYDISKYNNAIDLVFYLINNKELCTRLGKYARLLIEKQYSWDAITERVYKFYKNF